ncbi:MAG: hypothetical protein J3Q66DRAFT_434922 [Benniella sp.]|nr:MAG: hypothetical protein J3Q66DRAFT_434922 [Benniella sp.]
MKNLSLFLVISAALQIAVHAAPTTEGGVCNTRECTQEAENILKDLKQHVDPCVDFSEFACGGFYERVTIPEDRWKYGYLNMVDTGNTKLVKQLVTSGDPSAPKPVRGDKVSSRNIQRMQDYYAACMDDHQLIKAGREPLVQQLEQVVQLYSIPDSPIQHNKAHDAKNDKDALSTLTGQFLRNGLTTFVRLNTIPDINEPTRNLLYLDTGSVGLPADLYANPNATRLYEKLIGEMFYILYATEDPTTGKDKTEKLDVPNVWKDVAKDVVAFETALSKPIAAWLGPFNPETDNHLVTIADLNRRAPSLDWSLFFKNMLPKDVKIPKEIVLTVPKYLDELNKFLEAADSTTIQLYFAWTVIRNFGENLDAAHRRPFDDFNLELNGKPGDRSTVCSARTLETVPDIVSHYFVEAIFPERARAKVEEIIDTLRTTYTKSFQSYNWLDSYTRKGAIDKMKNFVQKIGYSSSGPDDSSPSSIDRFYQGLKLDSRDHFGNQVRASTFWKQVEFGKLNKKVDRMHMDMNAPTVNAYYSTEANDINFPAGILQSPIFHVDHPEYANYGSIGVIAGHEITHGFDNEGRKWDGAGHYRNWWSNSSVEAFHDRANCFVDQYSKFTVPGPDGKEHAIDGQKTLGENIADNGGIKKAFESWLARYRSDPRSTKYNNKRLPGLEKYTPEQMFFIQYGRTWCSKSRPEAWEKNLEDEHSPAKWRIIGVVQNSEYFAKAFQCKAGTPMNPVKKCNLW